MAVIMATVPASFVLNSRAMHTFLAEQAAIGVQPWAGLWHDGHGDAWLADSEYIAQRQDRWRAALLS